MRLGDGLGQWSAGVRRDRRQGGVRAHGACQGALHGDHRPRQGHPLILDRYALLLPPCLVPTARAAHFASVPGQVPPLRAERVARRLAREAAHRVFGGHQGGCAGDPRRAYLVVPPRRALARAAAQRHQDRGHHPRGHQRVLQEPQKSLEREVRDARLQPPPLL